MKKTLLLISVLALFTGCMSPKHKLSGYTYFDNPMCKGYGAVNYWHTLKAKDQADLVAEYGVNVYHIEFFGWADSRRDLDSVKGKYKDLLAECRKRKVVLFVSIFNDNSHLSKYGNTPWIPSLDYLKSALNFIIEQGSDGVIIQPVAETQTSVGSNFETYAKGTLSQKGFRTCYNRGSRPSAPPAGWTFAGYHPNNTTTKVPAGAVCVTDTGNILNQLGGYSQFDPAKVTAYGNTVLKTWHRPLVLYGFQHKSLDKESVKALGNVK